MTSAIIAGGRHYSFTYEDILFLADIRKSQDITEVISRGADAFDAHAETWATRHGIPIRRFPANWKRHGRRAGPIRNGEMARHADICIIFPGGRKDITSLRNIATANALIIFDSKQPWLF